MPVTVLVGCQWGDEGKGKAGDLLSRRMDWVARYGGGNNAGHTVFYRGSSLVLHLIPCGILQPRPRCLIGHGAVIDPVYLLEEMDRVRERGVVLEGRLFVSEGAHLVLPYHRWIESLEGQDTRIGTTRRGIGPAYQDKVGRSGLRILDLCDRSRFRRKLEGRIEEVASRFRAAGQAPPQPLEGAVSEWIGLYGGIAERLRPFIADTVDLLQSALRRGERILCEGAQGTFLDVDLGTYPFVTSSSTTAGGAAIGLGLPPASLRKVVGVCKAYATRVGEGPFPTELMGAEGEDLRQRGNEFGATTGRPRRVGWLDLVQLRQAVRLNGVTSIFLTKMDILSGCSTLRLCTGYEFDGADPSSVCPGDPLPEATSVRSPLRALPPADAEQLASCRASYAEVPGWSAPLGSVRRFVDLPREARDYVSRIEQEVGCHIGWISVGSGRHAVVSASRAGRP